MKKLNKKAAGITLAGAVALSSLGFSAAKEDVQAKNPKKEPVNVIMMVMDGTSSSTTTLSRWYKGGNLAMDQMLAGGVRTYSAESAITDSAPAGTALATGNKSNDKYVGILPSVVNSPGLEPIKPEDAQKPVANVLEGAKLQGKATGIIATSEIQHATPAGFSAHATHRNNYGDIAEQQVYQGIDVVLGGGKESLAPGTTKNARTDGENLLDVLDQKKYDFVENRDELLASDSNKIWGSFATSALAYDFDRESTQPSQPTLAEMTGKAINTLNKDEDGFFLFVEGSKVDWAAHANDPIGMISDTLAFDDAVKEAVEFAKKDGNTMVIALTDHGNSGISIGNTNTNSSYPSTPVSSYIDPLKKAKMTVEGALSQLKEDKSNLKEVAALYGLEDLTDEELKTLTASKNIGSDMSKMLAKRANLGFTTGGHTGEDVFLYSYGPSRPTGLVENTDIAKKMAEVMNFDLGKVSDKLYTNAEKALAKKGYTSRIDVTNPNNPVLVAKKGDKTVEFPVNKNIVIQKSGKSTEQKEVNAVTVYNGKEFYISEQALKLVK
ncbi:alkaline phosphatase [Domibacillus sp. DTU_2020_1001157_1_SI_ALB_TIR_016]|uniref:alkaline phosphatase n=1 Tax=Domibacillus sp. DTU_2020_1001157_1_SI_ALB_TIR_016 TaxID=3077789 RepID=UPI0028E5790D|nr:alkaline phosphatase [Domibacillus sp. DTU_2020_1001157_1_SI_ALB_TIR_016]WNS78258.1 alkaline phosphatase [Domibacillus sp. DTU_2020_1001157_1_SI_ALB_TIR_016]